jgi:beta-N-acetylhexosaminidase
MTAKERAGQLVMAGVPADDIRAGVEALGSLPLGGIFLSGKTTADAQTLAADIAAAKETVGRNAGAPTHVAVDQEGGYVQSLRGPDFPPIPSAVEQGQESTDTLSADTALWSSTLAKAGITLDLAPVADVVPEGTASENPPIGAQDRQYGSTPAQVSKSVVTVVRAMLGAKLGTTVKHFPGLGRVRANTDTSAAAADDQTTPGDDSLQSFQDAINAHTTAVMISSASYPQLDADHIAAFSEPIITGLLRDTMHFKGLVISDDLGAAVAVSDVPAGQRAVDFVQAGGDMALTVRLADAGVMVDALAAKAATSAAFRATVKDAALHVLTSKQSLGMLSCG